jgi:hypothetical protein
LRLVDPRREQLSTPDPVVAPLQDAIAAALVDAAERWERDRDASALRRELARLLGELG